MSTFSVSMCVYGKDNPIFFESAVESIITQTVQPSEIVLVVDGPVPDDLNAIICKYESLNFFNVIRLENNVGHGNARRIGLDNCTNELVALMDADDISVNTRFEKQLKEFAKNSSLAVCGGNISEFIVSIDQPVGFRMVPTSDVEIKQYAKKRCPMNQMTVMFKKSEVISVGGYKDWYFNEDYYLWIRLLLNGAKFYNIPDVLVNVRVGNEMYQRRGGWKYFCSEAKLQLYMRRNELISLWRCVYNICIRFVLQVAMPNKARGWLFRKFARESVLNRVDKCGV